MTDTRKESLSALIDGEASEIEVHRLVREFRSDETLSRSWSLYQHVRSTVRTSEPVTPLSPERHNQLFERISEAVSAEDSYTQKPVTTSSPAKIVVGSLALAASLVVAIFVGVPQPSATGPTGPAIAATAPGTNFQPSGVQTVANTQALPEGMLQASELVELDEEKQRRLRAYLNQHDRMARMNANQQLVNFKKDSGK